MESILFWAIGILFGVIQTILILFVKNFKNNIDKQFEDIKEILSKLEHKDEITDAELKSLYKYMSAVDKRLLEYQVTAGATFVMREDFRDLKKELKGD